MIPKNFNVEEKENNHLLVSGTRVFQKDEEVMYYKNAPGSGNNVVSRNKPSKGFEEHGIVPEESLNEVLTHELTHFMKFPGNVLNVLRLQKSAQGIADGHKVSELRSAFTEAQTNIYMLNERKHPATAKMRKAYGLPEGDGFGKVMYGLYQEVSGQDLGVEPVPQAYPEKSSTKISTRGKEKGLMDKGKVL